MDDYTKKLEERLDHYERCLEESSKLQKEILSVGGKYLDLPRGKTYCVTRAWDAIKQELDKRG